MPDQQTREVLSSILEMMKDQAIYLQRQRAWLTAIADTIASQPDLEASLKANPFFDLAPRRDEQIMHDAIPNIDALIRQLRQSQ